LETTSRAVLVTIGQLCFYDVVKAQLLSTGFFKDNTLTHFTSSLAAVSLQCLLLVLKHSVSKFDLSIFDIAKKILRKLNFSGGHCYHFDSTPGCFENKSYECKTR